MKKVRVGVLGAYRGTGMINYCKVADNAELVAICDKYLPALEKQKQYCGTDGIAYYTSFDEFIKHDMDAVVLANYANDPEQIALQLLGENKVCLAVSEEYLAFARAQEIANFIDFGWLRNAFIVDYIADLMMEAGLTNGFIASADGFTRNLDCRDNVYQQNLFNFGQEGIDWAGVMDYSGPKSLVFLRSYPMYDESFHRYYCYEDGRIVTAMIDPADGQSKASLPNLVSYSETASCGQLALAVMPVFVADDFAVEGLNALTSRDIYSIWFQGKQLHFNQPDLSVALEEPYIK